MVISLMANWKYIFKEKKPVTVAAPATDQVQSHMNQQTTAPITQAEESDEALPEKIADYKKMQVLALKNNWEVDPFGVSSKLGGTEAGQNNHSTSEPGSLHLESILITQYQSLAVINSQLVAPGDVFQGKKISKITKDSVFMETNGKLQELKLNNYGIPTLYLKRPFSVKPELITEKENMAGYQGNQINGKHNK